MNNDDDTFFQQFHKAPRQKFADALYQRINRPMNAQKTQSNMRQHRRLAMAFAAAAALFLAIVFAIPTTRASAINLARQIGAFLIVQEPPSLNYQATAVPFEGAAEVIHTQIVTQASEAAGFAVLVPSALPDGYEQKGGFSISPNGAGKNVVFSYTSADGKFLHFNQYQYAQGDAFTDYVAGQEALADVTVRGQKGAWITNRYMTDPTNPEQGSEANLRPTSWLIWEENGIVTTLMTDGLSLEAALAVAETMK
jgi:hypothetical protein